jgi:hypothetical protein
MRRFAFATLLILAPTTIFAHTQWVDGSSIPPWVKAECCGEADAHRDDLILRLGGKTYVQGLDNPVDEEKIFDSQDGRVWAFYNQGVGRYATVYCLFVPPSI